MSAQLELAKCGILPGDDCLSGLKLIGELVRLRLRDIDFGGESADASRLEQPSVWLRTL